MSHTSKWLFLFSYVSSVKTYIICIIQVRFHIFNLLIPALEFDFLNYVPTSRY